MDLAPEPRDVPPPKADRRPDTPPGAAAMAGQAVRALGTLAARVLASAPRVARRAFPAPPSWGRSPQSWGGWPGGRPPTTYPRARPHHRTPRSTAPITATRCFAFTSLPCEAVTAVKNAVPGATRQRRGHGVVHHDGAALAAPP